MKNKFRLLVSSFILAILLCSCSKKTEPNNPKETQKTITEEETTQKKVSQEVLNLANKSFVSSSGKTIIFALPENKQPYIAIKENGKETTFLNANLKKENGKIYVTAIDFNMKLVYKPTNVLLDEDTNIEYKLQTK